MQPRPSGLAWPSPLLFSLLSFSSFPFHRSTPTFFRSKKPRPAHFCPPLPQVFSAPLTSRARVYPLSRLITAHVIVQPITQSITPASRFQIRRLNYFFLSLFPSEEESSRIIEETRKFESPSLIELQYFLDNFERRSDELIAINPSN